jgi:hypothetical protein
MMRLMCPQLGLYAQNRRANAPYTDAPAGREACSMRPIYGLTKYAYHYGANAHSL